MKITRIAEQVKQKGRYSIFIDGDYAFSLSAPALLESGFASGRELDHAEVKVWQKKSAEDLLYSRTLRYVAMRPRSEDETRRYLQRHEASPALADIILNKLRNLGLLDDAAYAQSFVANRQLIRPTSIRKLQHQLRAKQIDDVSSEQALRSAAVDERAALRAVIAKKRQLARYRNNELKLVQYLSRQGFRYEDIKSELAEYGNED